MTSVPDKSDRPDLEWILLADYVSIDKQGKLSINGIFRTVNIMSVPTQRPSVFVVTAWRGVPSQIVSVELRVWSPARELMLTNSHQAQLGPDGRTNGVMQLSPFPIAVTGTYVFEILADGVQAGRHELAADFQGGI